MTQPTDRPPCPFPLDTCTTRGKKQGCGKQFFWAVTEGQLKSIPVDPDPVPSGNLQLVDPPDRRPPMVRSLSVAERFGKPALYISHFATCPFAEQHRTQGRRSPS
jgi:hypothetical protein